MDLHVLSDWLKVNLLIGWYWSKSKLKAIGDRLAVASFGATKSDPRYLSARAWAETARPPKAGDEQIDEAIGFINEYADRHFEELVTALDKGRALADSMIRNNVTLIVAVFAFFKAQPALSMPLMAKASILFWLVAVAICGFGLRRMNRPSRLEISELHDRVIEDELRIKTLANIAMHVSCTEMQLIVRRESVRLNIAIGLTILGVVSLVIPILSS